MNEPKILSFLCCLLTLDWNRPIICVAYIDVPKIKTRTVNPVLAQEGDINIGYLADITTYDNNTGNCGPALALRGCMGVEMAIYAINEINRRQELLPNITLGFVIIDGCSLDLKSLEVATYFIKENDTCSESDKKQFNTTLSNRKPEFSSELKTYDVIGIVGPQTSATAQTVSVLMGVFETSMIGIHATSDALSDKSRYEYFMRLVAPDSRLVLVLIEMIEHYGWKYISVLYSAGSYGENAYQQVQDMLNGDASTYGICIAVAIKISSFPQQAEYDSITDSLISNENAKIIITFISAIQIAESVFGTMLKKRELGTFVWLGADSMVDYEHDPLMVNVLDGIFFVDHPEITMPDFESYVGTVTPMKSQGNSWILKIWENEFNCTFDSSSVLTLTEKCSDELTLDSTNCPLIPSLYDRIHDAFLVYAQAAHEHITAECPEGFNNRALLKACDWGDAFLQRIMQTTFHGVLGKITFDENGDYTEDLVIKQYYKPTSSSPPVSKVVGFWNYTEARLYMNESEVSWKVYNKNGTSKGALKRPVSVCSQPCLRNQYMLIKQSQTCCWTCLGCRNNEIILANQTGCLACPMFTWPDDETARNCLPISPVYLEPSNIISVTLFCLATILILFSVICASIFLFNRQNKMLSKLNIKLNILIILGILVACVTVILLVVPPDASKWICTFRNVGFNIGLNMIYSPLLVKNVLISRFYFNRKKNLMQGPRYVSAESQMVFFSVLLLVQVTLVIVSEIIATSETSLKMPSIYEDYVEMYCNKSTVWFMLPLAYNIIIMVLCAGIGFITRKLTDNFNESWFIFLSVVTTLFAWIVFIPVYFTISFMYLQPVILGFALILNALVTLICQYLPIIYALVFVPDSSAQAAFVPPNVAASNAVTPNNEG